MNNKLYVINCEEPKETRDQILLLKACVEQHILKNVQYQIENLRYRLKFEKDQNVFIERIVDNLKVNFISENFRSFKYSFDSNTNRLNLKSETILDYIFNSTEKGYPRHSIRKDFFIVFYNYVKLFDYMEHEVVELHDEIEIKKTFLKLHSNELSEISKFVQLEYWLREFNSNKDTLPSNSQDKKTDNSLLKDYCKTNNSIPKENSTTTNVKFTKEIDGVVCPDWMTLKGFYIFNEYLSVTTKKSEMALSYIIKQLIEDNEISKDKGYTDFSFSNWLMESYNLELTKVRSFNECNIDSRKLIYNTIVKDL